MAKAQMAQVTVLQPILAGDPGLAAILAEQLAALPEASFRWLVDDDDSEAQRIVAALAPPTAGRVQVQSFAAAPAGCNPKAFKLARALPSVTTEYVLVLDDDARAAGDFAGDTDRGTRRSRTRDGAAALPGGF